MNKLLKLVLKGLLILGLYKLWKQGPLAIGEQISDSLGLTDKDKKSKIKGDKKYSKE